MGYHFPEKYNLTLTSQVHSLSPTYTDPSFMPTIRHPTGSQLRTQEISQKWLYQTSSPIYVTEYLAIMIQKLQSCFYIHRVRKQQGLGIHCMDLANCARVTAGRNIP